MQRCIWFGDRQVQRQPQRALQGPHILLRQADTEIGEEFSSETFSRRRDPRRAPDIAAWPRAQCQPIAASARPFPIGQGIVAADPWPKAVSSESAKAVARGGSLRVECLKQHETAIAAAG
jgi:hypothetical protein